MVALSGHKLMVQHVWRRQRTDQQSQSDYNQQLQCDFDYQVTFDLEYGYLTDAEEVCLRLQLVTFKLSE